MAFSLPLWFAEGLGYWCHRGCFPHRFNGLHREANDIINFSNGVHFKSENLSWNCNYCFYCCCYCHPWLCDENINLSSNRPWHNKAKGISGWKIILLWSPIMLRFKNYCKETHRLRVAWPLVIRVKKWPYEIARKDLAQPFFREVFFRVTHDRHNEREINSWQFDQLSSLPLSSNIY